MRLIIRTRGLVSGGPDRRAKAARRITGGHQRPHRREGRAMKTLDTRRRSKAQPVRLLAVGVVVATVGLSLCSVGLASAGARHSSASACASPPTRIGRIGGIQWASKPSACPSPATPIGFTLPSPAYHGTPPLINHLGAVTGTTTPGELTVTPVYWVPSGYSFPAGYETLVNQFVTDAATDSGKTTNVFAALPQYTNASAVHLSYLIHA